MKTTFDGMERLQERRGILNAGRPQLEKIGMQYAGTMDVDEELPYEDILAIRKGIIAKREEEMCRRVKAAIGFLVISVLIATVLVMFFL